MEEGVVTDPREADVGSILGFGFAPLPAARSPTSTAWARRSSSRSPSALAAKHGAALPAEPLLTRHGGEGRDLLRPLRAGKAAA